MNAPRPEVWLLRFRWFVPLALLPLAILAAGEADPDLAALHPGNSLGESWEGFCLVIALGGLFIRALAVGFEPGGRAGAGLPDTGIYSIVRYPLYLGTYISLFGLSLLPGAIWFVVATSVIFFLWYARLVLQTERALAERHGDAYRQWAARIPMFLPNPFLWRRPRGSFSFRKVLRLERNDFYFVVAGFVGLELACDLLGGQLAFRKWLVEDAHWALLLAAGTLLYAAFRTLAPRHETAAARDALVSHERARIEADGPFTRGLRVDGRVRLVDALENLLSGGNLDRILVATLEAAALEPGDRLVDVGCGSGALAVLASADLVKGEVVGIDATPGMIELARERARHAGSAARFHIGTAEALPFADGSVDALTSSYLFHHLPSDLKRQVLQEMWRALKPGGRLVITDYSRPAGILGCVASFPMRFDFHEYVRGQIAGELANLLRAEQLGRIEVARRFLGYITVYRIVKPGEADRADRRSAPRVPSPAPGGWP